MRGLTWSVDGVNLSKAQRSPLRPPSLFGSVGPLMPPPVLQKYALTDSQPPHVEYRSVSCRAHAASVVGCESLHCVCRRLLHVTC